MSRYIDADQAIDFLTRFGNRDYRRGKGTIREAIKALMYDEYTPTVEVKPVIHGVWLPIEVLVRTPLAENYYCSECCRKTSELTNFCPECGADMRGDAV